MIKEESVVSYEMNRMRHVSCDREYLKRAKLHHILLIESIVLLNINLSKDSKRSETYENRSFVLIDYDYDIRTLNAENLGNYEGILI